VCVCVCVCQRDNYYNLHAQLPISKCTLLLLCKKYGLLVSNHSLISYSFFTFASQAACLENACSKLGGESRLLFGRFPNLGKGIISYKEVFFSVLKNVNHYADKVILCNHIINGHLLKTSVLTGRLCCLVIVFAYR
jgi:hypothetical protein